MVATNEADPLKIPLGSSARRCPVGRYTVIDRLAERNPTIDRLAELLRTIHRHAAGRLGRPLRVGSDRCSRCCRASLADVGYVADSADSSGVASSAAACFRRCLLRCGTRRTWPCGANRSTPASRRLPEALGLNAVDAGQVIGARGAPYRYASIGAQSGDASLWLVERHGYAGFETARR